MWWCSCTLCFVIHLCFLAKNQWGGNRWDHGDLLGSRTFTYSFQMSRAAPKLGVLKQGSVFRPLEKQQSWRIFLFACLTDVTQIVG